MTRKGKPQFFQPPSFIGDKVPRSGGPSPAEAIAKALRLADDLIDSYQGWAVDDLQKLWQAFGDGKRTPADVRALFNTAHEIRGQGGTFKFPLISLIADSLCKFLEPRSHLEARDLEIVRIHILAMKAIFAQQLKGQQEALFAELKPLLPLLRSKA
ncbi:MAG: Hpt domain-containing protein [Rhodospirillales bacterium]